MKSLLRIVRRYIGAAFMIMLTMLILNFIFATYMVLHYTSSPGASAKAADIAREITVEENKVSVTGAGKEMLEEYAFAFLLDEEGNAIWEWNMPKEMKRHYTLSETAVFSRWYIEDYPVTVWQHDPGLLVLGLEKNSIWKGQIMLDYHLASNLVSIVVYLLLGNLVIILLLCLLLGYRFYCSLKPIAAGIEGLSKEEQIFLKEKGMTTQLAEKLNHTSEILQTQKQLIAQRDTARTNWIAGVSHDIRTPLSMIMGYAEQLEAADNLEVEQKRQLGIIKNQGIRIKKLIEDLNLTSKLEYQMQPLRKESYYPARLMREIVTSYYNNGLSDAYTIELQIAEEVERMQLDGDVALLTRAYENLIGNSIRHNESCQVEIVMCQRENQLEICFKDDGVGIPKAVIMGLLEEKEQGEEYLEAPHIMGMRVVKQIILAHQGNMEIEDVEIGASIRIFLPTDIM